MSVVTQPFHAAVNHLLQREPWAREQLEPYAGKRARLNASPFSVVVRVTASGFLEAAPRVASKAGDVGDVTDANAVLDVVVDDVTITVLPDAIAAMLQGGMPAVMKHVRIEGDAEFAATLGKLAEHVRWDPEEDLSRLLGDAAAHRLGRTARTVADYVQRASRGLLGSITEYWLDERPQWVRHRAVESFTRDLAELRDDAERLEKRLERLEKRLSSHGDRT